MGNPPDSFPKNGKNRAQTSADRQLPEDPSCGKPCHTPQSKVPAAQGKAGVEEGCQQARQEQQVTDCPVPGPQRP